MECDCITSLQPKLFGSANASSNKIGLIRAKILTSNLNFLFYFFSIIFLLYSIHSILIEHTTQITSKPLFKVFHFSCQKFPSYSMTTILSRIPSLPLSLLKTKKARKQHFAFSLVVLNRTNFLRVCISVQMKYASIRKAPIQTH